MTRPVQELAGFKRVGLLPGESKTVVFTVHPSQMAFLTKDMKWKIERGEMDVRIGASSADIRLQGRFDIAEDRYIDGKKRAFYAADEIR